MKISREEFGKMLDRDELIALEKVRADAEKRMVEILSGMPNWSQDCDCGVEDIEIVKIVHEGEIDEVGVFCVKCGGLREVL